MPDGNGHVDGGGGQQIFQKPVGDGACSNNKWKERLCESVQNEYICIEILHESFKLSVLCKLL